MREVIKAEDVQEIIIVEGSEESVFKRINDAEFAITTNDRDYEFYCPICMGPFDGTKHKVCPSCKGEGTPMVNDENDVFDTYDEACESEKSKIFINGVLVKNSTV